MRLTESVGFRDTFTLKRKLLLGEKTFVDSLYKNREDYASTECLSEVLITSEIFLVFDHTGKLIMATN